MGLGENMGLGGNTWSQVENGCLGLVPSRHFSIMGLDNFYEDISPKHTFFNHGTGPKQAFLKTWDWIFSMKISSPKHTFFNHGTGPKQAVSVSVGPNLESI